MEKTKSVVRCDRSGVFFGEVTAQKGHQVKLEKARQIYYWTGAFTCLAIAKDGIGSDSKLSVEVEEVTLTDAIEIIPCTEKAEKIIEAIAPWEN